MHNAMVGARKCMPAMQYFASASPRIPQKGPARPPTGNGIFFFFFEGRRGAEEPSLASEPKARNVLLPLGAVVINLLVTMAP